MSEDRLYDLSQYSESGSRERQHGSNNAGKDMTTLDDMNKAIVEAMNSAKGPKITREKYGKCIVCGMPTYKLFKDGVFFKYSDEKDEEPRFQILKNSKYGWKTNGFSVINVGAKSHSCIINEPTQWTSELFVKEIEKKVKEAKP
tara:strand:- start:103 stop:534 length:432 start_codon:yes stop_codon:yes gene_type:complete